MRGAVTLLTLLVACSGGDAKPTIDLSLSTDAATLDEGTPDLAAAAADLLLADSALVDSASADLAPVDLGGTCALAGATGECMMVAACAALTGHNSFAGHCPGPAAIQCCVDTRNPPFPAGYKLMTQAEVTPAMTTWAVAILHDPVTYPMFSTAMMTFGSILVLARVEWHPPDFQNSAIHRGVTLYEPM